MSRSHYDVDWSDGWEQQVVNLAKHFVKKEAIQATQLARAALAARHPGAHQSVVWNTLDFAKDANGQEYLDVGYRMYHTDFHRAFYETGNRYYAPSPVIAPAVINAFQ